MKATTTSLRDVVVLEPDVVEDERGFFFESFNHARFAALVGREVTFVQDNHSLSRRGVVRGLHYQIPPKAQGKLVRVVRGAVFDVAVDLRKDSPTCGRWTGEILSAENRRQLWIPAGFAHGFQAISEHAEVLYKTTDGWSRAHERCIAWDDPALAIAWPNAADAVLSKKDREAPPFSQAELFAREDA